MESHEITGLVDSNGNFLISEKAQMAEFMKKHKGAVIIGRLYAYPKGDAHKAIKGYYYHKLVPDFRKGYLDIGERYTEEETEKAMRRISPICHEESVDEGTGQYIQRIRQISELSMDELVEHITLLKQVAAEYLHLNITDWNDLITP